MPLTHLELRQMFANFWSSKEHHEVPPIPLIPKDDPTTLFTGSGMQQLVPYLLGEPHPQGKKLYNIQPCLRAQDIEEVGNNRHTTFFEMMGNWSLGTYFKKEQLPWFFEFLTTHVGLDSKKLYVTVFKGEDGLPADEESVDIWKQVFKKHGIDAKVGERILPYGGDKNWWSRGGAPKNQPVGDPGGPDSEVFFDFGAHHKFHENSRFANEKCHVNCDCGRYIEIGNSVFMQYRKQSEGVFTELPKKNVDFGGGLERILAASYDNPDVFATDLFAQILEVVQEKTDKKYEIEENKSKMRVIADHMRGAVFLTVGGVRPSNKEHGYVLRRLLRRSAVKMYQLKGTQELDFTPLTKSVFAIYDAVQGIDRKSQEATTIEVINEEMSRFAKSLERGLREIKKIEKIDGKKAFDMYQSYGFPLELTEELFEEKGQKIDKKEFYAEFEKHQVNSRTASVGKFKGGLADQGEQTVKYHTATHLLHQALFDVMGDDIRQDGSNITADRLRFDFYSPKKPTPDDYKKVEQIINKKVQESLPVNFVIIPKEEALQMGARAFFKEKYGEKVKIYFIGAKKPQDAYSKEFCGGPHVKNTKEVGKVSIYKFETLGSNLYRVYAK